MLFGPFWAVDCHFRVGLVAEYLDDFSQRNFQKVFKNQYGITAGGYRKTK